MSPVGAICFALGAMGLMMAPQDPRRSGPRIGIGPERFDHRGGWDGDEHGLCAGVERGLRLGQPHTPGAPYGRRPLGAGSRHGGAGLARRGGPGRHPALVADQRGDGSRHRRGGLVASAHRRGTSTVRASYLPSRSAAAASMAAIFGLTVYLAQRAHTQTAQLQRTNRILEDHITQRADAERRTNLALDAGQMGTWELDLATDTSVRSLRHDQIFGYTTLQNEWGSREFLGVSSCPRTWPRLTRPSRMRSRTGAFSLECRIRWPDASLHWISAQGRVERDAHGDPVRILGIVTGHHGSQDGGGRTANGQRRRRSREPGQERVPGEHESRDPDADERRHRDDRSRAGHRAHVRTAGVSADRQIVRRCAADRHQRHPGLLQDGGGQVRARPDRLQPPRCHRRHGERGGAEGAPEGPRTDRGCRRGRTARR